MLLIHLLADIESVPRREEGSTGKYQHEVEGVPEGAAIATVIVMAWLNHL